MSQGAEGKKQPEQGAGPQQAPPSPKQSAQAQAQKPAQAAQQAKPAAAPPAAARPAAPAKPAAPAAAPKPPQPVVLPPPPHVDVGTVAVVELLEAIVNLKRSGLLGMISYLADKAEDSFLSAATDPALMRLMAILASVNLGLGRLSGDELASAQNNIEDLTRCGITAMGNVDLFEDRKLGALGAGYMLRDPDVGTSLWVLLQIAKNLGRCVRERYAKR